MADPIPLSAEFDNTDPSSLTSLCPTGGAGMPLAGSATSGNAGGEIVTVVTIAPAFAELLATDGVQNTLQKTPQQGEVNDDDNNTPNTPVVLIPMTPKMAPPPPPPPLLLKGRAEEKHRTPPLRSGTNTHPTPQPLRPLTPKQDQPPKLKGNSNVLSTGAHQNEWRPGTPPQLDQIIPVKYLSKIPPGEIAIQDKDGNWHLHPDENVRTDSNVDTLLPSVIATFLTGGLAGGVLFRTGTTARSGGELVAVTETVGKEGERGYIIWRQGQPAFENVTKNRVWSGTMEEAQKLFPAGRAWKGLPGEAPPPPLPPPPAAGAPGTNPLVKSIFQFLGVNRGLNTDGVHLSSPSPGQRP